ncbi:TetR/AcrR family transcriptional regulator [Nocardiopsis sp. B62]|uniref:TetR/AcrR family transcriptional regulator n=1 Tax=Nocardiopsis sp. B62 TaxID=2824874 RepID=UPI001B38B626|nr:TetR/AcrR family transcriptional regulator [Nocardiopsis sp. B62]MBQ1079941.1 TetR/AcrR family transcriptional regulator [Nocardiopsis sp. B62]
MSTSPGLRDLTRRAVRDQILAAAEDLFREQGYDQTTVDDIAARVGMSQRTFFRHAGSKDELVLASRVQLGEEMVQILKDRPGDEDPWVSLRHCLEVFVAQHRDPAARERAQLTGSIIESSPTLRAAYLERMEVVQRRMADVLRARSAEGTRTPVARGLVGAAFAALGAATERCLQPDESEDFAAELDHVMAYLTPQGLTDRPRLRD